MGFTNFPIFVSDEFSPRPFILHAFNWDQKLHICLSALSPMRATFPFHLILIDMIVLVLFGEEYELRKFSLCNFLNPDTASAMLGSYFLLNTLFSKCALLSSGEIKFSPKYSVQ
jgi:hypothetical protein